MPNSIERACRTGRAVRRSYSVRVAAVTLEFEREIEFPRVIVWDALVDEDLVSGWLADADIEPELGGEYRLHWMLEPARPQTLAHIVVLQRPECLAVEATDLALRFELDEIPGGTRGTSTRLRLAVRLELEPSATARAKADWLTRLDQLRDLLYGHPVNWATWGSDMQQTWSQHLGEVGGSTA